VAKLKNLGMTSTNQQYIHDEIKSTLDLRNACYHVVLHLLSSWMIPKNLKIKIYNTIILPSVLYLCKTWPLTLREEHRLRVFENRVLRRTLGPERDKVTGGWIKFHNEERHKLYFSPHIVRMTKSGMERVMRNVYKILNSLKRRGHSEDLGI
jgi:hypothetical protein